MSPPRWYTKSTVFLLSLLSLHILTVSAIGVTANSPCGASCVDSWANHGNISSAWSSFTVATDFVCRDSDLKLTSQGRKWTACLGCESTSSWWQPANPNDVDPGGSGKSADAENDVYWFLHGIEATLVACIWGTEQIWGTPNPNDPSRNATYSTATACTDACTDIHNSLVQNLTVGISETTQYNYCENFGGAFLANSKTCRQCLDGLEDAKTLGRYIGTLNTACAKKPNATLGQSVSSTNYFAQELSSTSTATSTPTASTSATSTSSPSSSPEPHNQGLSTGAKAGIGIGVALGALLILALIVFFVIRRRRSERQAQIKDHEKQAPETSSSQGAPGRGVWDPIAEVWRQENHEMDGETVAARRNELHGSEPPQSELHGHVVHEKQGGGAPAVELPGT